MHVCIGQPKVEVIVDICGSWQSSFQFPPPIRIPNSHFGGGGNPHYELFWREGNSQSLPLIMEPVSQTVLLFTP